ncbi:MAG: RodZ domain-containing protein [Candidatus Omnitrophota bacterium]
MAIIGQTLKKAREEKNITLEELQRATKIQMKFLVSLEEEAFERLPNPTYVKGFIKQYAQYVGLDPEPLLNEYNVLNPEVPPQELEIKTEDEKIDSEIPKKTPVMLVTIIVAGIVVISLVAFGLSKIFVSKKSSEPSIKTEIPFVTVKKAEKPILLVKKNEILQLTAKASQDTWMHIKCDGKIVYQSILKAGSSINLQAKEEMVLWVGNAASLELNLNGHNLGSPGRGVMKNILITHEGMKLPK